MARITSELELATAEAERQEGVISLEQLLELGIARSTVKGWLRSGRLRRLFRGVYAFGHRALRPRAWWRAALLACDADAALSHLAAAMLFGWTPVARGPIDVTTLRPLRGQQHLRVHRTRRLVGDDVVEVRGIRVTSASRTLVDLADVMPYRDLRALADQPKHLDLAGLAAAQARCPGRRGARSVARLLARDEAHTKSEMERRYGDFCRRHGVPLGDRRNVWVGRHKVDVLYVGPRVVVELDGRAHHERRAQMRSDRTRDVELQLADYLVVRLLWEDLDGDEAAETLRRLRPAVARRGRVLREEA